MKLALANTSRKSSAASKTFTGFRHDRRSKVRLVKEANKRGWSVSQLVEKITDDWINERN